MREFVVWGQKLGKSKPFIAAKTGEVIWDGVNRHMTLGTSAEEKTAKIFLANIRKQVGRTWKLWIEKK